MTRGVVLGVLAALAVGLLTIQLSWWRRCIDTEMFFAPATLVYACIGVAALVVGGAFFDRSRPAAIALAVLGALLVADALSGPPFHACAQFSGGLR